MSETFEKPIPMSFNAVDRGPERALFNVFNGRVYLTIFAGNQSQRLFNQGFNLDALTMLKRDLKMVRDGQPGTTRTIVFQKWVPEAKKFDTTGSLIMGKDDKQIFYLEVQFNANGNHKSIRFNMRASGGATSSTDDPSEQISSSIRMAAFLDWLENYVPIMSAATSQPYRGNNNRSGGGSGGSSSNTKEEYSGADASF